MIQERYIIIFFISVSLLVKVSKRGKEDEINFLIVLNLDVESL